MKFIKCPHVFSSGMESSHHRKEPLWSIKYTILDLNKMIVKPILVISRADVFTEGRSEYSRDPTVFFNFFSLVSPFDPESFPIQAPLGGSHVQRPRTVLLNHCTTVEFCLYGCETVTRQTDILPPKHSWYSISERQALRRPWTLENTQSIPMCALESVSSNVPFFKLTADLSRLCLSIPAVNSALVFRLQRHAAVIPFFDGGN